MRWLGVTLRVQRQKFHEGEPDGIWERYSEPRCWEWTEAQSSRVGC